MSGACSADQEGAGGAVFREWGGSASLRYDRGGDGLGFTVTLSPSWALPAVASTVSGPTMGDLSRPRHSPLLWASRGVARLDGEIGYGFAAFADKVIVTPFGGLALAQGTRDWQLGQPS